MEYYGAKVGFPRVINVGPGAAIDVDVTLSLEPGGGFRRRWRAPVLTTGDFRELVLKDESGQVVGVDQLAEGFSELRLTGTCADVLGEKHTIDATFPIREWWELANAANERLVRGRKPEVVVALERIAEAIEEHRSGTSATV